VKSYEKLFKAVEPEKPEGEVVFGYCESLLKLGEFDKIEDQLLREIAQQAQALEERLYKLSRRER